MAGDFMMDPVVIYVGNVDALQANKDVTQTIHVVQVRPLTHNLFNLFTNDKYKTTCMMEYLYTPVNT